MILVKAGLPEAQSPEDAMVHPSERRLKPAPRSALAWHAGERNLRDGERYLMKIFKEISGPPKSRYIRTTGTNVGSPTGREPYLVTGVPVVVVGFAPHQGVRESRKQGEGEQVTGRQQIEGYAKCKTPKRYWASSVKHSRHSHWRARYGETRPAGSEGGHTEKVLK